MNRGCMKVANKLDIDKIVQIRIEQQKEDWKEEYFDKYNLEESTKKYLEQHLNNDFFAFIEEENNVIIAICCLQIIDYLPQCNDNGKQGYICNVYTSKKYRNRGIQTNLLNEVIKFAIKNDLCELNLSTDSETAISIYQKLGFKFDNLAMTKYIKGCENNE